MHDYNYGGNCSHDEVDTQGVCESCGIEVEGWEPDDAQLLTQTGTKEPVAAVAAPRIREEQPMRRGDREYLQAQWDHSRTPERYGGGLG